MKVIKEIQAWAEEKGIYAESDVTSQLKITAEEVVEAVEVWCLWDYGYAKKSLVQQELGDIGVTLVNACHLAGFTLEECLEAAHAKNSKRTGKMVNGKWTKSEDLK